VALTKELAMRDRGEYLHLAKLRYDLAAVSVVVKFGRLRFALRYSDRNQQRVPAGQREGSQWSGTSSRPGTRRTDNSPHPVAQSYSFGVLVAEIPNNQGSAVAIDSTSD
jgi:phosphosulfolactate phosphohydrolase-like enzyme